MQPERFVICALFEVSILTGPEGPMQPGATARMGRMVTGFNPHRPRRADATGDSDASSGAEVFQSSPAPKGRCNLVRQQPSGVQQVSILTGPEGPMQQELREKYKTL